MKVVARHRDGIDGRVRLGLGLGLGLGDGRSLNGGVCCTLSDKAYIKSSTYQEISHMLQLL